MPFLLLRTPVAKHWKFNQFSDLEVIKVLPSILHGKVLLWHYGKERRLQSDTAQRTQQWFQVNFIPALLPCLRENFSVPLNTKRSYVFFLVQKLFSIILQFHESSWTARPLYNEFYLKVVTRTQRSCMSWGFLLNFSWTSVSLRLQFTFFFLS